MNEHAAGRTQPTLPPLTGLIAGSLVILGVFLWMFVAKGLLVVAGLGAFGPGILRELGWLRDQDEFQRQAAHRAGYHAYLIGGLTAILVVTGLEWRPTSLESASEWTRLILVVLWMSWLFSALLAYWGAQKTASRVLITFGSFWAVFAIASVFGGAERSDNPGDLLVGALMGVVLVAPFFLLAWTANRSPRGTGAGLLAVAGLFFVVTAPKGGLQWSTVMLTDMLLLVPLIACGIALLREERQPGQGGAPADVAAG